MLRKLLRLYLELRKTIDGFYIIVGNASNSGLVRAPFNSNVCLVTNTTKNIGIS